MAGDKNSVLVCMIWTKICEKHFIGEIMRSNMGRVKADNSLHGLVGLYKLRERIGEHSSCITKIINERLKRA